MADEPISFMARLKRHHIFRVASAYAVSAYILILVANAVFPDIGLSRADVRYLIGALALLFPVVLVLGWMFIPPSKENPDKFSHWQKLRWRMGSVLTLVIVVLVTISGIYLWRANVRYMKTEAILTTGVPISSKTPVSDTILPNSIAVLPFTNLSDDPANQYFSDGISEEILVTLGQVPGLMVIGRSSSFQFRGSNVDPRIIRRTLRVGNILAGSIQRAGDKVRITAELVDTQTGVQLWSQHYDRKFTHIFAIEDDISRSIATTLQLKLAEGGAGLPILSETKNPEAHRLYLVGLEKLETRGPALRDAILAFQQAIKADPNYAQAWGALAEAEILLPDYGIASLGAALPRAETAARRALALDPNVTSAYVALGIVHSTRWQWSEANQEFNHAIKLAPGDSETINQYAQFLWTIGQLKPALAEIEHAQQLDPLSAVIAMVHAHILFALRNYSAAFKQIESTLLAHPDFALAHNIAALMYSDRQQYQEAEKQIRAAAKLDDKNPDTRALLIRGIVEPDIRAAAVRSLEVPQANSDLQRDPMSYAEYYMGLTEYGRAIAVLESYVIHRNSMNPQFIWDPSFDMIHNEARFKVIIKKMRLPYIPRQINFQ